MNILWILVLVLIVLAVVGGGWGYRSGYYGTPYYSGGIGIVGVILIVLVILLLMGRL